jgi:hypothetical protein
MKRLLRALLCVVAVLVAMFGVWGVLANLAIPLMPAYGKTEWNYFASVEQWDERGGQGATGFRQRHVWWALSFQTPYPYLDPVLAGPVGYGFYTLCIAWGASTLVLLRPSRWATHRHRQRLLAGLCWLIALLGIMIHLVIIVLIAIDSARIDRWSL